LTANASSSAPSERKSLLTPSARRRISSERRRRSDGQAMIYPSKKDWWVALLLLVIALMDFGIGGVMLYDAVVQAAPLPVLLAGFVPVLVAGLIIWIYVATGYDISPPNLVIRCGPMWFTIPLDAIAEVQERSRFSLELGWNFALSQDRVFIKYRKPNGKIALFGVVVSPE